MMFSEILFQVKQRNVNASLLKSTSLLVSMQILAARVSKRSEVLLKLVSMERPEWLVETLITSLLLKPFEGI